MGVWVISEKNILQTDFEGRKNLARKYLPDNGFVCIAQNAIVFCEMYLQCPVSQCAAQ